MTRVTVKNDAILDINLVKKEGDFLPATVSYLFNIYRTGPVKSVIINGTELKPFHHQRLLTK